MTGSGPYGQVTARDINRLEREYTALWLSGRKDEAREKEAECNELRRRLPRTGQNANAYSPPGFKEFSR